LNTINSIRQQLTTLVDNIDQFDVDTVDEQSVPLQIDNIQQTIDESFPMVFSQIAQFNHSVATDGQSDVTHAIDRLRSDADATRERYVALMANLRVKQDLQIEIVNKIAPINAIIDDARATLSTIVSRYAIAPQLVDVAQSDQHLLQVWYTVMFGYDHYIVENVGKSAKRRWKYSCYQRIGNKVGTNKFIEY
jgi:uncharacterized membrane protein